MMVGDSASRDLLIGSNLRLVWAYNRGGSFVGMGVRGGTADEGRLNFINCIKQLKRCQASACAGSFAR